LQVHLVHLEKLEVLEIQDNLVQLERLEHLAPWEREDHQDLRVCKAFLDHQVFQECLVSRETEDCLGIRGLKETLDLQEDLVNLDLLDLLALWDPRGQEVKQAQEENLV